jgi:hypothetical protein
MAAFARDDETAELLRRSTALRAAGDWDGAIAALYAARDRMMVSPVGYPADTWLKLPRYLHRAGRKDEARGAHQWILDHLEERSRIELRFDDPNVHFGKPKSVLSKRWIRTMRKLLGSPD